MKVKTLKKVKDYDSIYNKEIETKEIELTITDKRIFITEQQCGMDLNKPHIIIQVDSCTSYEMDFDEFIKCITK
jgi:hypothetical protein